METESPLPPSQVPAACPYPEPARSSPGPRPSLKTIRNMIRFYGEELLAPRPTPKLEDHPLSAVRCCLFNTFASTLHIGGRSSTRNLRTRHTMVTGAHLSLHPAVPFHIVTLKMGTLYIAHLRLVRRVLCML
jgi:hypothetical protein